MSSKRWSVSFDFPGSGSNSRAVVSVVTESVIVGSTRVRGDNVAGRGSQLNILIIRWPAPTWGAASAPPPASSRRSLYRLLKKFRNKGSLQDLRKRRLSSREGVEEVCNDDMVDEVRAQLVPYLELFWVRRSWVGPMYLVIFSCWGGPSLILRLT